jgi:CHAT domain-containing protein/lipopolysaccharide biosynthesis regulator YciM
MNMKNPVNMFFMAIFIFIASVFFIAVGFLPVNDSLRGDIKNINQSNTINLSKRFKQLDFSLKNSSNIINIKDSIKLLTDNFEKSFLLALLDKRKNEFTNSFNELFALLPTFPEYYPFYDELILLAKASDNVKQIEKFINNDKRNNLYKIYLSALLKYHSNNYREAVEILKDKNNFDETYLLSYSYRGLGDFDQALQTIQKAETLLNASDNNLAKVLVSKGSLFFLSGNYDEAEKLYQTGLEVAKNFGDKVEETKALINLAIIEDQKGIPDEAKLKLESALKNSLSIENKELEATVLSELAVSYTYSGDIVEAKNNYEKSLRIFKILNHKERLSNLCANIASLYTQIGNYSAAMEFYNNGLEYAGDNVVSKILNLRGLGDVYANLSNYSKSLSYYEEAKKLSQQIKDTLIESSVDISIGTLYYNINKPIKALQIFLEAKNRIGSEKDLYTEEDMLFKIGLAYAAIDSIKQSNKILSSAYDIAKSVDDVYYESIILTEIGHNHYLQKEYSNAEHEILKAINLSQTNTFNQLLGLQNIYLGKIAFERNNVQSAIKYFETALSLAVEELDYNNIFESEYFLAKSFLKQNKIDEAEKHYLNAIELIDKISESLMNNSEIQISHFSGFAECYNELAEVYFKQNRNEDAFLIIEKSHSRNTLQNLTALKINSYYNDKEKLNSFYDLKWYLNSGLLSGKQLEATNNQFENIQKDIFKVNPELKPLLEENNNLSVSEIQKKIGVNENLVTLFFGKSELYYITLTKDKLSVNKTEITKNETIKLLKEIAPLYSTDYQNADVYLNQDLFSFNAKAANNFYNNILQPVVKAIPVNQKLIFSMPAELALVPVEFLVTEFDENESQFYYNNTKFLIDDYPISYSPSASIYVLQKMMKQNNKESILFVGDPQISNKNFSLSYRGGLLEDDSFNARSIVLYPLRYSKEEITKLNSMFSNGVVLLSDKATEKNFKENASQSSIIHLSTHSFLLRNQPLIVFTQNNNDKEDGYLETGEILQLKLNSDLVVLSSCRSGLGAVDEAEGVIGMQKSFFEAGAKSILVSLWDVNDKYTSLFMQSFYKYLNEGYDKSEALRNAKIFFRKNYSANPYYWSAFILSGDVAQIKNLKSASTNYIIYILLCGIIIAFSFYFLTKRKNSIRYNQEF